MQSISKMCFSYYFLNDKGIAYCLGGNFDIHIRAWSGSPSIQGGGMFNENIVTSIPIVISYNFIQSNALAVLYLIYSSNLKYVIYVS